MLLIANFTLKNVHRPRVQKSIEFEPICQRGRVCLSWAIFLM